MEKKSRNCIDCNKPISRRAHRCMSCANRIKATGKTHTLAYKLLMKKMQLGTNNSNYKHGKSRKPKFCLICKSLISWQSKYCKSCAQSGKKNSMFGKLTPHGIWQTYKGHKMRSSWEVAYAKYLDKNNIKWLYESKTFDLGNTTYTPDFYLPKENKYIEIKGYWRQDALKKFRLFKDKYKNINIEIIDNIKDFTNSICY